MKKIIKYIKRIMMPSRFQLPLIDEAGIKALEISENVKPKLTAREQSFFIAGFSECVKYLNQAQS